MEKILSNIRIIDPSQKMDEIGNIIIDDKGKIKSIGKDTKSSDVSKNAEKIDLEGNIAIFNPSILPFLFMIVKASNKACVGCSLLPSPAFITEQLTFCESKFGAPES